jgi:uncharacterized DUF497 family protein
MRDAEFEWDDRKAAANAVRHGVTFETARLAFEDAFAVVRDDRREDYGEDRCNILGMVNGRLLYVSYTIRQERIRIISARGAEPYEKRLYHEANS